MLTQVLTSNKEIRKGEGCLKGHIYSGSPSSGTHVPECRGAGGCMRKQNVLGATAGGAQEAEAV